MLDFTNTEIAFSLKTNAELRKAQMLFKLLNNARYVRQLSALASIAAKYHLPIGWLVKPVLFSQFVGGTTLKQCVPTAERLWAKRVGSILDYAAEGKKTHSRIRACFKEIRRSVELSGEHPFVAFSVFKPTALINASILEKVSAEQPLTVVETGDLNQLIKHIDTLCAEASAANTPILIDAEDYCYQKAIDDIAEQMMERYNVVKVTVFTTLQMYRTDRLDYLKALHQKATERGFALGIKFVRGAYMEKERERAKQQGYPSPINATKEETDRMYNAALTFAVENINKISIFAGTHNAESIKLLADLAEQYSLAANDDRIWFSQLYGMSDNLSFNLASEGFNVAKYLPYGPVKEVIPYLVRRAKENTSTAGQLSRELMLINQEINRRKKLKEW